MRTLYFFSLLHLVAGAKFDLFTKTPNIKINGAYRSLNASRMGKCGLACFSDELCHSFDYNSNRALCFLHYITKDQALSAQIILDPEFDHFDGNQKDCVLSSGCANNGEPVCTVGKGAYRGTKSTTAFGVMCQRWDSQNPHNHTTNNTADFPDGDIGHNYCRNPDGDKGPWCYTVDAGNRRDLCFENCPDINECNSNPCQNGGVCVDQLNGYNCTCALGYSGTDCDENINECNSNPCQNGATCVDQINGYNCTCAVGYNGTDCDENINECNSNPCQNGATCVDQVNGYNCTCAVGFSGTHCDESYIYSDRWIDRGEWGNWELCPNGTFAYAMELLAESDQLSGDDSALNGIKLHCNSTVTTTITSTVGLWGFWRSKKDCPGLISGFRLSVARDGEGPYQNEPWGPPDNVGACNFHLWCSDGSTVNGNGNGWGEYQPWEKCPSGWSVCGLRTQVQGNQGGGDDTSLNNVDMKCCYEGGA